MTDTPVVEDPPVVTTINPGEEHWSTTIVGDNTERAEALKEFETPEAFFEANDKAADWRRGLAGDDDKFMSTLERYSSPADVGNAFREQKQMISAGQLKAALGPDATEEDITAYREANGIPLEATGYMENLPDGLVIGDDDKEIMTDFMGTLHAENVAPTVAHKIINWYNNFAEKQQDAQAEIDQEQTVTANTELRESWGNDYRANINMVGGLLESTFGVDAKEQLLNGRLQDGRAVMNDPLIVKGLAEIARKLNPVAQLTPGGHDASQTMNDEIAEIEKFMRESRTEYNKDVGKQERLRQLYQIRIDQAKVA